MYLTRILSGCSLFVLLACPVMASEPLQPRAEVSVKGGSQRSLLTTEFWAPLAQQKDKVLYGDIRLMGDNDDNREGNLGVGYRQVKNDAVLGVHGWIDRRRTQHNSTFHQLTLGAERLGHIVDVRSNIYIPLNQGRSIITPNLGVSTPYLAGSGIYYDTNGLLQETPQYGVDWEVGYRLPLFQKKIDTLRVYGGGYYFFRDNTVEVPGTRFRTEAQVNKALSVGARVQYDKPRGTQGFLEATLKFPFSAKRLYQESRIRSRLDESPERDVDIVTESNVIDTGLRKPILNTTTGIEQRILYVDNTKSDSGDGSYEKPFNNLKVAEAALQANDILYVSRGDGTTRNMDKGIVIDKPNIQLIGSGVALTYGGITFLNAGMAPVITNTSPRLNNADYVGGNGIVSVGGGNISITGVSVADTGNYGIYVLAQEGSYYKSINISQNTVSRSGVADTFGRGIFIRTLFGGKVEKVALDNNTIIDTNGAGARGIEYSGTGYADDILVYRNTITTSLSSGVGIVVEAAGTGLINNANIQDNFMKGLSLGVSAFASNGGGTINSLDIYNNQAIDTRQGISVSANNSGFFKDLYVRFNKANGQTSGNGINIQVTSAAQIGSISILNNTSNSNISSATASGVALTVSGTDSRITSATIKNNELNNNSVGVNIQLATGGGLDNIVIDANQVSNSKFSSGSSGRGILFNMANATTNLQSATISSNIINASDKQGIYIGASANQIQSISIGQNTILNSGGAGIFSSFSSGSKVQTYNISSNNTGNSTGQGIYIQSTGTAPNTSQIGSLTFSGNISNGNLGANGFGIQVDASGNGAIIGSLLMNNNTTNNNAQSGIYIQSTSSGVINNNSILNSTSNNNTQSGMYIYANNGTINNSSLSNITTSTNSQQGVYLNSTNTGILNGATLSGITANSNLQNGLYINGAAATTSVMNNVSVASSNFHNNTVNGIYLQKGIAGSTFNIDIGGGASGSIGQNRSSGNTSKDLRLNYTGGGAVFAKNNWWGDVTGLQAGRVTLSASTTVDSTAFLTVDPRP